MLVDSLGQDEMAPMYVMRIWAHCQNRKATHFDMPAAGLKALCRYSGDAEALESALVAAGFVTRTGSSVEVTGWAEHNSKLIAVWANGAKGGRPAKSKDEPAENQPETKAEPNGNQTETNEKPIGEEEIGEDLSNPNGLVVASDAADLLGGDEEVVASSCPHQKIISLYHEILPTCPRIRDWTPARATQLRARWNEDKQRQDLAWWRRFFEYVAKSDFLTGRKASHGKEPFFADLEWITKSSNFVKIREGKYENREKK